MDSNWIHSLRVETYTFNFKISIINIGNGFLSSILIPELIYSLFIFFFIKNFEIDYIYSTYGYIIHGTVFTSNDNLIVENNDFI